MYTYRNQFHQSPRFSIPLPRCNGTNATIMALKQQQIRVSIGTRFRASCLSASAEHQPIRRHGERLPKTCTVIRVGKGQRRLTTRMMLKLGQYTSVAHHKFVLGIVADATTSKYIAADIYLHVYFVGRLAIRVHFLHCALTIVCANGNVGSIHCNRCAKPVKRAIDVTT